MFFWPLRITASTADSHSVNRSSILLGASFFLKDSTCFVLSFFLFNGKNRIELRSERFWNCEQCGAIPKFSAREGGKSESRRRRRRKQEVFDCRASILLGAINNSLKQHWFGAVFFILNESPGIELRKERLQKGEQCAAFLQFAVREGGKSESRRRRRKHDKNYILVIFIITVCPSVAFTNCNSRHPWLAANAEFIWKKTGGFRLSRFDSPRGYK